MSDPRETFQLECNDLLTDMEEALLVLESNTDDFEQVNAIFRAMHTIKGTSGVFGYDDIVSFTHVAESVLDKVRANELGISSELVAVLLESMDHTKILIEAAISEDTISEENRTNEEQLLARLHSLLGTDEDVSSAIEIEDLGAESQNLEPSESEVLQEVSPFENSNLEGDEFESIDLGNSVASPYWHISIRFDKEILENGMDPLSFFTYLRKMGDIIHLTTLHGNLPLDESFNAENNYLCFELVYDSDVDETKIEETFEFVKEMCSLHILPPNDSLKNYAKLLIDLPEDDELLGDILVASDALSNEELQKVIEINRDGLFEDDVTGTQPANEFSDGVTESFDSPENEISEQITNAVNDVLPEKKSQAKTSNNTQRILRVDAEKLDSLINLVGELVIAGATTNMVATQLGDEKLLESMSGISRLVEEIRDNALNLRMVQVGETFNRFKRVVRDVSKELGKDIKLTINGADTELDKTVVEKIGDPLMHLVRNSMDHGIESAEERQMSGKDVQGNLTLNAYHDAGYIVLEVKDDGKGLDKERILAKALEKSLITENQLLTDQEIYQLVFAPGFSTAEAITNLSGRGVGMDVVNQNIEALRGTVDIDSVPGEGSTVSIRLPLTLAIIDGFLVKVGDSSYVIPLDMVHECIDLSSEDNDDSAQGYINLRGEVLPFLQLRDYFKENGPESSHKSIVVVRQGNRKAGFVVDELLGELQTVIKPMGKILKNLRGISGATILGSGEVAVILDVPNLIQRATKAQNIPHVDSVETNSSQTLH